MHELYYAKYTITFDKDCDEFASTYLFKAEEPHNEVHTYRTFQDFFKAVKAHKYPWGIPESNYTYREPTGRFFKPFEKLRKKRRIEDERTYDYR